MATTLENTLLQDLPTGSPTFHDWVARAEARRLFILKVEDWFQWSSLAPLQANHPEALNAAGGAPKSNRLVECTAIPSSYPGIWFRISEFDTVVAPEKGRPYFKGSFKVWGVLRYSCSWARGTVVYELRKGKYDFLRLENYQNGDTIEPLLRFTRLSPQQIWEKLGDAIRSWNERRQSLAEMSALAVTTLDFEEMFMQKIAGS